MGKSSSKPKTPDYVGAAKAEGQANLDLAKWQTNTNRVSQSNPYGQSGWSLRPGADPNNPQPGDWQQSTTLSGAQQGLLNNQQDTQGLLSGMAKNLAGQQSFSPINASQLPSTPNWGSLQTGADAYGAQRDKVSDATYRQATKYYDQRFGQDENALRTQLANQGLQEGSEAWNNAYTRFSQNKNDAYASAADQAVLAGGAEQSRMSDDLIKALTAQGAGRSSELANLSGIQDQNSGLLQALMGMSSPSIPQFSGSSQNASLPQGADLTGALSNTYQSNLASSNAEAAQQQNLLNSGLMAALFFSDRRLKTDIIRIGQLPSGLNVYEYTIFGRRECGVMAHEARAFFPNAVIELPSGYLAVDYSQIG